MLRIKLFITEIFCALTIINIKPDAISEIANLLIIVFVRVAFYFFERHFGDFFKRKKQVK